MKVYLANGLFSLADYHLNQLLAEKIRENYKGIDLFVPQEAEINDKNSYADSKKIFELDYEALSSSDVMVAVIDGVEMDSGVACEIGIAAALNIPVIALYSDVRQLGRENNTKIQALIQDGTENQFMYRNLFVIGAIKKNGKVVSTIDELVNELNNYLN